MSITDELRKYASRWLSPNKGMLLAIADRIDAEHERLMQEQPYTVDIVAMTDENMAEHGWVRLPKDADGEVIHVGDVMERMERCGKVVALQLSDNPWGDGNHWAIQLEGENAPTVLDAFFHHHHEQTVEDLLEEMSDALDDARIPNGSEKRTYEEIIAEYAAKLQLRGDGE